MKISGQLLKKIIKEEVQKFLEQEDSSNDAKKVVQSISRAAGFEQRVKAIDTQEELEELLQFIMSEIDSTKIDSQKAKKAIRTIFNKL